MDVEKTIREYLPDVIHLSLATCVDNKPWVCELHFVYDNDLNLYFISKPSRRHSQEIAKNPNVAGNIVKQHGKNDKPRGVYFEGTAQQLGKVAEGDLVYNLYKDRFGIWDGLMDEVNNQPDGHKFYKITPKSYVVFDLVNSPKNPRQEWQPRAK